MRFRGRFQSTKPNREIRITTDLFSFKDSLCWVLSFEHYPFPESTESTFTPTQRKSVSTSTVSGPKDVGISFLSLLTKDKGLKRNKYTKNFYWELRDGTEKL